MIKKALKKVVQKTTQKSILFSLREYNKIFIELKNRVKEVQLQSSIALNKNLIALYWVVGKIIT